MENEEEKGYEKATREEMLACSGKAVFVLDLLDTLSTKDFGISELHEAVEADEEHPEPHLSSSSSYSIYASKKFAINDCCPIAVVSLSGHLYIKSFFETAKLKEMLKDSGSHSSSVVHVWEYSTGDLVKLLTSAWEFRENGNPVDLMLDVYKEQQGRLRFCTDKLKGIQKILRGE